MGSQAIDLSAGLLPKQQSGIDLSAGLIPKQAGQTLDPNQPAMQPAPNHFDPVNSFGEGLMKSKNALGDFIGQVKDAIDNPEKHQSVHNAQGIENKVKAILAMNNPLPADQGQGMGNRIAEGAGNAVGQSIQGEASLHAPEAIGDTVTGVKNVLGDNPAKAAFDAAKAAREKLTAGNQAKVMPEDVGRLPMQAQEGAENIFRAAAPTGMNQGFRANVYAAAPDLADIARKINLSEAKGGVINPDMRVRATVEAINGHLDEMYQKERAPQIQAHTDAPVDIPLGDATRGLQFIKRSGGTLADQALAEKAIKTGTLTLAEADKLAMTANQYLKSFESMTASEKLEAVSKTPKIAGLKALDVALGNNMNKILTDAGEQGIRGYERRYAALSEVRDQLATRINAEELKRSASFPGSEIIKGALKGKSGITSASQAAVADVNIGKQLQSGMQKLGSTPGLTAQIQSLPAK